MSEALTGQALQAREPGASICTAALEAAVRAGSKGQSADPRLLRRVVDGLRRLPGPFPAGECAPAVLGEHPPSSRWQLEER